MPFRLTGRAGDRAVQLVLRDGVSVLGSGADCALRLDHRTVSRAHAEIVVRHETVEVRDLKSRNGTFVAGRRISQEVVGPGTPIAFGQVDLILERVAADDLAAGITLAQPMPEMRETPDFSTVRTKPVETFAIERLPLLVELLADEADEARLAQAAGSALFDTLPVVSVDVTRPADGGPAVLFTARREVAGAGRHELAVGGGVGFQVAFPEAALLQPFEPVVRLAAALTGLASRSGRAPIAPPALAAPRPPEPASVVPEVQRLYAEAARVARGIVGVLILGESGTGKEVLARYIHAASPRAPATFVALNCAALPRDLLETELFGIERGVATGVEARAGKFELAHGGTLFLDEIGDMALETQAKILRVLQEKAVHRIGGVSPRAADVRIVAATNREMPALLAQRSVREDLYYRIATWTAQLPPLRRRRADIPNLAVFFLTREAARAGVRVAGISRAALELLTAYDWPGNIRQLENEMARAVLFLGDGQLLDTSRLGAHLAPPPPGPAPKPRLSSLLEKVEGDEIRDALDATGGDVARAAARLGLGRSTLYRRMKALGIEG